LAKNYAAMAYYDKSADVYEEYVTRYPTGRCTAMRSSTPGLFHKHWATPIRPVALKHKYMEGASAEEKDELDTPSPSPTSMRATPRALKKQFKAYFDPARKRHHLAEGRQEDWRND